MQRILSLLAVLVFLQPIYGVSLACFGVNHRVATTDLAAADTSAADDCCPDAQRSDSDASHGSDGSDGDAHDECPCPFRCALGCGAQPRAIVAATVLPDLFPVLALVGFVRDQQRIPSNPEPFGILHVPITARA